MDRRVVSLYLSLSLMLLIASCSGKNISSSSGDVTAQTSQGKSEEILPDAIKTIPLERSFNQSSGSPPSKAPLMPTAASRLNILGDVFFEFDRFQISTDAMSVLDTNAGWLRANENKTVLIEGHCDERGTAAYNLILGEKRARAAKKYLQDAGVLASQLQITSYGETRPFCKQANEDCYQQNRRAHFVMK
jgi:peptidoglycan-associated lipoprotein